LRVHRVEQQHVTSAIQRDIAARVGGLIWRAREDD
jgi:hypothetical protein